MKPVLILASAALLAACNADLRDLRGSNDRAPDVEVAVAPPIPQPAPRTAKERLVEAIESNGCVLTAENVSAVLNEATISAQELTSLAPQLEAEGRAEVSGTGAIRVRTDACALT